MPANPFVNAGALVIVDRLMQITGNAREAVLELLRAESGNPRIDVNPGVAASEHSRSQAKRLNAILLTCGTYNAAGDFAYHVGLPAKSGIGGGVLAVIPGWGTLAAWGPALDGSGNSVAGQAALARFTTATGRSIF